MKVHGDIEFTIIHRSAEQVVAEMPVQPGVINPFGVVHAGAMLWFADVCATVLAYGKDEFVPGASGFPLGVSLNAAFVGNQQAGVLTATSSFVKREPCPMRYEPERFAYFHPGVSLSRRIYG
ncbi:PaaI family thioesterase [Rhodoferax sp.]|uniref:PaaI family thioesterase n=1 Tax=Rhodoferax sp. TaxID=50421 RepID=UPI00284AD574|nr:PaaI family thioesterase [Rhodoferax sp.]MDR3370251.1 PaaI family thioesterase [Rhodoferax sp.]